MRGLNGSLIHRQVGIPHFVLLCINSVIIDLQQIQIAILNTLVCVRVRVFLLCVCLCVKKLHLEMTALGVYRRGKGCYDGYAN